MNYMDIPSAETMFSVTNIHKFAKELAKENKMREHIVTEISNSARGGYSETLILANGLTLGDVMYDFFAEHDTYKGLLQEFETKGYRCIMQGKGQYKTYRDKDVYAAIFISWDPERVNLEKGEDK